jgi:dipeptidyl aminopeptidase/acylaminoacyl peptidase
LGGDIVSTSKNENSKNDTKVRKDIRYGKDTKQKLDVYQPQKPNGAVIIVIHGGGWWQGDKKKEILIPPKLANEGYLVIVPNYRLVDGEKKINLYPTQVEDLQSVVQWLKKSDYEFDPQKIGIFGSSSGGNLAAELGVANGYPTTTWSALIDFETLYKEHPNLKPEKREINNNTQSSDIDQIGKDDAYYKWVVGNLLGWDMSKLKDTTVINRVNKNSGPMFLVNSLNELVPAKETLRLGKALVNNEQEFQIFLLKGKRHAEGYYDDAIDLTVNFFKRYLL